MNAVPHVVSRRRGSDNRAVPVVKVKDLVHRIPNERSLHIASFDHPVLSLVVVEKVRARGLPHDGRFDTIWILKPHGKHSRFLTGRMFPAKSEDFEDQVRQNQCFQMDDKEDHPE